MSTAPGLDAAAWLRTAIAYDIRSRTMKATITKCDVCGDTIPDGARRLRLIAVLTIVNGHEREASKELPELCGSACVTAAVNALLREAEALPFVEPATPMAMA